jgi:phospholipid/cholesterol/gamma-HCH transport system substrate-binding protein
MLKYRGHHLIRTGLLGVVLIVLVVVVGLQPERLVSWATHVRYQAVFAEAGGLDVGDDVMKSGVPIGEVADVSLHAGKALVTFAINGKYRLRSDTTAHIRTGTLLGERMLTLESAGDGTMSPGDVIPVSRTSSPYSLTEALGDLATTAAGTDTQSLNQALDTLSATIDQIAPQLGPTFDGLTRLSRSLNSRDDTLRDLLKNTANVSGVLAERSQQVNTLILNANDLIGVLNARRQDIVDLLEGTSAVSQQLSALVADNQAELAPVLDHLNSVTAMLEKNRDSIAQALPGLAKYGLTASESVATGPYFTAFQANLFPSQLLQPFLDYAFGFRRGVDAGQPPDNAGPRAEIPFPYNGIPGGSR